MFLHSANMKATAASATARAPKPGANTTGIFLSVAAAMSTES
jgi:hypothetical protein